jgi:hypothetical protein
MHIFVEPTNGKENIKSQVPKFNSLEAKETSSL